MNEQNDLRVLHLFGAYLPVTVNWAFRLISHLPNTKIVIGSKTFIECDFYADEFEFVRFPLKKIRKYPHALLVRVVNKAIDYILKLYPLYIKSVVGHVDIIHSHFANVGWEYYHLAKWLKVPQVVSFYGFDYECIPYNRPIWKDRYQKLFREVDMFLCEGHHGAHILETMGCPGEKIRVARLGVEVDKVNFHRREKQPLELRLLQIASLTPKKGHIYTVQAFMEALKDCPNMTLTLVGRDMQGILPTLTEMIRGTPAEARVEFVSQIDFSRLYEFMGDYQVFIHPSCYSDTMDCEGGAPVVLLDAQATGMPVISTTHCDIPDEVIHGQTGLLSSEKDVAALVESIQRFYTMTNVEYQTFAVAARRHVETEYDVCRNSAIVREIYQALTDQRRDSS